MPSHDPGDGEGSHILGPGRHIVVINLSSFVLSLPEQSEGTEAMKIAVRDNKCLVSARILAARKWCRVDSRAIVVVVCLSVTTRTSPTGLDRLRQNFFLVVQGMVRNVYLRNRPDPSRFGRKKSGKFEFFRFFHYVEEKVVVLISGPPWH